MKRRTLLAAAGTGALAALAGCGTAGGLSEDEYDVGMSSTRFLPERHEVAAGDRVVWGNTSSRPHTVTAYEDALPAGADFFASGGFSSQGAATEGWRGSGGETGAVEPGETYARTFDVPGTYRYFCVPHEAAGMVGEIVVSE